jgi:hypothetical protein
MVIALPDGPELTAGLRKLLEAKDCLVRAALDACCATFVLVMTATFVVSMRTRALRALVGCFRGLCSSRCRGDAHGVASATGWWGSGAARVAPTLV